MKRKNKTPKIEKELKFDPFTELPKVKTGDARFRKKNEGFTFMQKRKFKKHPETTFLVEMFFSNGTTREYIIRTKEETFSLNKRTYYLRYEDSRFNLTMNQYKLFFHDDSPVPIDLEIIKLPDPDNSVPESKKKAFFSVTSSNLKTILNMRYLEVLAEAQDMNKMLRLAVAFSAGAMIGVAFLILKIGGGVI